MLKLLDSYPWTRVNICSDSQSVLWALKNAEMSFFPKAINKLNTVLADLSYRLSRINFNEGRVRFTWCPAHVGIEGNEMADRVAKQASVNGENWNNPVSYKEISSALIPKYREIDFKYCFEEMGSSGSYFFKNFDDTIIEKIKSITRKREECKMLIRIITSYPGTSTYLFKIRVKDSPNCMCDPVTQDLNHIFWSCPRMRDERERLLMFLRTQNLFDPFSIEYLIGNINKKIAAIMLRFAKVANEKLNICKAIVLVV